MNLFTCDGCGHPVHFENDACLHCGSTLAFLPDAFDMAALSAPDADGLRHRLTDAEGPRWRLCHNHDAHQACNMAVPAGDPQHLCVSCRQTQILPDLTVPGNAMRWVRIEQAKRRLFYTLAQLGLESADGGTDATHSPVFQFLADVPGSAAVLTGHHNGVITLNIAEADDEERTRRRLQFHEPYRTLLGHLRHESGHFYWPHLFATDEALAAFRDCFGDERADYGLALQAHHGAGPQDGWPAHFVSAYATAHPWEDWAETWAHYLHLVDLLETASAYRTQLALPGADTPARTRVRNPFEPRRLDFDRLLADWVPVTLLVNSLNRSLGQDDAYPFALAPGALRKLRFVHDTIAQARG